MATLPVLVGPSGKAIADRALPGGDSTLIAPVSNTTTIYLDDAPLSSATGIPLTPGSTQPWPGDRPCFAWSSVADQQLLVGAGVDQGTNAGAIAAAIIDQGLAQQIAQQISVTGAPPIDDPQVVVEDTWTTTSSAYRIVGGADLDVARYQSLTLRLRCLMPAALAAPADWGRIFVFHYQNGLRVKTDKYVFAGDNDYALPFITDVVATIPAVGDMVQVQVNYDIAGVDLEVVVLGSYRDATPRFWGGHGFQAGAGGPGTWDGDGLEYYQAWRIGAMPNGATWNGFPTLYSGPVVLGIDSAAAVGAGTFTWRFRDQQSGNINIQGDEIAGGSRIWARYSSLIVPNRPVQLVITNNTGGALAAGATISLTQAIR